MVEGALERCPHWSPDGHQIAFTSGRGSVFVVSATGGLPRRLTTTGGTGLATSWSWEGR